MNWVKKTDDRGILDVNNIFCRLQGIGESPDLENYRKITWAGARLLPFGRAFKLLAFRKADGKMPGS